uniref:PR domain zinc finger protein 10 n=1 Tax=Platynereis dumerilii TaxID=6359 RepID=A0A0D6E287_PLADU|nr:PRDM10/15 [Platynereis dumerilii]
MQLDQINSSINSSINSINSSINSSVINSNVIDTSAVARHPGDQSFDCMLVTAGPSGFHLDPTGQGQLGHIASVAQNAEYIYQHQESEESRDAARVQNQDVKTIQVQIQVPEADGEVVPYQPKPYYNPDELWCEDCQTSYMNGCTKHSLSEIHDKVVFSRAWASLPQHLQIFRLGDSTDLGVFAKRSIPRRTQFGPFIAELVESRDMVTNKAFSLQVEREGHKFYFEATDENKCNWMMFVRPAQSYDEQNLVAYQYGSEIYFCTTKHIQPRVELKVWYSAQYAERLGLAVYVNPELEKWECYECNKKFRTPSALQRHYAIHLAQHQPKLQPQPPQPEEVLGNDNEGDAVSDITDASGLEGRRVSGRRRIPSRKLRNGEEEEEEGEEELEREILEGEEEGGDPQVWKKKKTSIYLSKYKKYHRDTIKKSIKSLYKRKGKETGGQEWVCTHCDLTFDNPSLLNLHTLTHAAEDIGMDEIQRLTTDSGLINMNDPSSLQIISSLGSEVNQSTSSDALNNYISLSHAEDLSCPVCNESFSAKKDLIQHAAIHAKLKNKSGAKPYKCKKCWKSFGQIERLQKHMMCHGAEEDKPLQCSKCPKRFMNNSALACHLKIHSDSQYYDCIMCGEGFDQVGALKKHVLIHRDFQAMFPCGYCHRTFKEYSAIRKHIRAFHSEKKFQCDQCDAAFTRYDKLKLHALKHSNLREFMCENCGRQFKRRDKLREHVKRMHAPGREKMVRPQFRKKFVPKVSPNDYQRFIYKCNTCMVGFKRRGMLVNHLAKKHPDTKPDQVPELNLPILKTQRDYFCQYCDKVYKSSSKRKAHIMKQHPGSEVPPNIRGKDQEDPNSFMTTYCQMVGSVTAVPQSCTFCHKQYASKAKLLQHQRKKHSSQVPPVSDRRRPQPSLAARTTLEMNSKQQSTTAVVITPIMQPGAEERLPTDAEPAPGDPLPGADLLTQAMSELTQGLTEYRVTTPSGSTQIDYLGQRVVQAQVSGNILQSQPSTIELSQLGLVHTHFPSNGQAIVSQGAVLNPQTLIVTSSAPQAQTTGATHSQLITRSWNNTPTYQT